jgi:hypothetical protein
MLEKVFYTSVLVSDQDASRRRSRSRPTIAAGRSRS